jgi:integrase
MARKGGLNGNGTIDQSGKGAWRLRFRINGKRFATHFKGTKAAAQKELRRLIYAGDTGKHVAPSKLTFGQWVIDWLALKERSTKARTVERYSEILSHHVTPVLGEIPLQKITTRDIDALYGGLTLAPRTAQLLHVVLKACFASAAKKKLIPANPVADAERPAGDGEPNETILDEQELGQLVKGFEGYSLYPIVAVAAFTGMRRNEILALRLDEDIKLDEAKINVTRNVEETDKYGRRIVTPKAKNSVREFQIDASLVALLRQVHAKALRMVAGVPDSADVDLSLVKLPKDALAFPEFGTLTKLRSPDSVTNIFIQRARKLGFANVSLHDLRASHSTAMLDRGVPVHVVAKRIGDDPATLLRSYAKRTKKADANAAEAIAALMKGVL